MNTFFTVLSAIALTILLLIAIVYGGAWLVDTFRHKVWKRYQPTTKSIRDYGWLRGLRYAIGRRLLLPHLERRAKAIKITMDGIIVPPKDSPEYFYQEFRKRQALGGWIELLHLYTLTPVDDEASDG